MNDKKAEWIWGVLDELEAAGLATLANEGYQGARMRTLVAENGQIGVPERGQPCPCETPRMRGVDHRTRLAIIGPSSESALHIVR